MGYRGPTLYWRPCTGLFLSSMFFHMIRLIIPQGGFTRADKFTRESLSRQYSVFVYSHNQQWIVKA